MELKRHHIEGKACLARDVALLFDRITNLFFVATLKDMASSIHFCALLLLFRLNPVSSCLDDQFRELEFPSSLFFEGERLINHVIASGGVMNKDICELQCYMEHNCVSINFEVRPGASGAHNCDLNNSTQKEHEKDLVKAANYVYHGTNNACGKSPCKNNAICQSGFTSKGYRCLCTSGFTGEDCEHVISYNCSDVSQTTGVYTIWDHSLQPFPVYCDQTSDGGGWTMIFKVVGGVGPDTIDQLWSSSDTLEENVNAALDTTSSYRAHYKNRIVHAHNWQTFRPQEARVVLYTNGTEVTSLKFNATGTDNLNWFSQNNLVQSPWTDLNNATDLKAFGIKGDARTFEISHNYGGCDSDSGWLLITQSHCPWETRLPVPSILYSHLSTFVNWNRDDDVGVADVMIVFIR